ncbi:TfoX/Sxy family DNA transformation protein [Enterococcus rivorum]|uniref:TfoX C-terminal domain-containing protein n=2 Tax=Enterococcus rivorum TaxID=762845 RepID=A0A1E5KZT9_9ENTE|nr:TfoX/Sxy family DNA transformation protein [Enterococcus rivorum]OEH83380.1 hypothetical protein BCR26_09980 [Enterococcus rivorum]
MKIEDVDGIGKVSSGKLKKVGIHTAEKLDEVGSKAAFLLVFENVDKSACLSFLYSLEAGCRRMRTVQLPLETKKDLQKFYKSLK